MAHVDHGVDPGVEDEVGLKLLDASHRPFGEAVTVLVSDALAGAYLPARRAMRIDLAIALRGYG